MSDNRDLLIEIGVEELPIRALQPLSNALAQGLAEALEEAGLKAREARPFAAPRRLGCLLSDLPIAQPDRQVERRGPALTASFDDEGNPTKAALGFARSCGVTMEELGKLETPKGAWLVYRAIESGRSTAELIPELLDKSVAKLPIPKRMRWGEGEHEFVRPLHWLLLLWGEETIRHQLFGVQSGRSSRGHRFHHPEAIDIERPESYLAQLREPGRVLVDFGERRALIRQQVQALASELEGKAVIDNGLLDEVTALVEWPRALAGRFDAKFLEVPQECLISTMQDNQKYFPVVDGDGRLMPHFITVANIESRDEAEVRRGNERVIAPRFTDAEFFWNQDRKRRLDSHIEGLKSVVFQEQLGTLYDKSERAERLARAIADQLGGDPEHAARAARLAKCDLNSSMVFEFPELQGIMGRYYALHDGEPAPVAEALDEQYMPRHAGDALPAGVTGQALAIADKLDTLIGIFAIGQRPTGVKDPFGLRRAALGVLRIMIERQLPLDLDRLLQIAAEGLPSGLNGEERRAELFDFMMDRLKAYYGDRAIRIDVFEAVLACRPTQPLDFDLRVRAVNTFLELPEAESLAAANKRICNILKKTDEQWPEMVDPARLVEESEIELARALEMMSSEVEPIFDRGDYSQALTRLAALRTSVDTFFDAVMVMTDDRQVRLNRLALLDRLSTLFLRVADLSKLQG